MASIIRIKRSNSASAPTTLGNGELAYSAGSGTQANGGERLYIGFGTETNGGAPQFVIGGKYFTDLLDHTHGTLTASSALLVDSSKKVDNFKVDNIDLDGNTISSTDTDGNLLLDPNGSGYVQIVGTNGLIIPSGTSAQRGPSTTGSIRYNTDTSQFEGYSGVNWSSLGGVRSVDGLTYIIAESSPAASDDILHFYAATGPTTNAEVAQLSAVKLNLLQTTTSTSATTGALVTSGGVGIGENLNVSGTLAIGGTSTLSGNVLIKSAADLTIQDAAATPATVFEVDGATGNTTIAGTSTLSGNVLIKSAADLTIKNAAATPVTVFEVDGATGNTTIAGTLTANTLSVSNNLTITGNLTVNGTTTTINSTVTTIDDPTITLGGDTAPTTNDGKDRGIEFAWHNGTAAKTGFFGYDNSTGFFTFIPDATNTNEVFTGTVGILDVTRITGTASAWTTSRDLSLTGDATATLSGVDGTQNISTAITLATVNTNTGTFGSSTSVPTFTVNGKGLITAASETAIPTATAASTAAGATLGLASFYSTEFDVNSGYVSIKQVDGGTY